MKLATILVALLGLCSAVSPFSFLSTTDRDRLKIVLEPAWTLSDLAQVLYASAGYKQLGMQVPNKDAACSFVKSSMKDGVNIETIFFASTAGKNLGCPLTASAAVKQAVLEGMKEGNSAQDLYYAVSSATNLGISVDSPAVVKAAQQALKKDDSVLSLGYTFHVAAQLKADSTTILFERIEDAVVQADEVDGKMLQFEGGLSITALVLSGVYRFSEAVNKAPPIKAEQSVKFSNYLMSRKSVQMPKGVFYFLEAVTRLTTNKFHIPVSITLASSVAVSSQDPKVKVRVTDLMGKSLGSLKVTAYSANRDSESAKIVTDEKLIAVAGSEGIFEFDLMKKKPERGFYHLTVSVASDDKRLVGHTSAQLALKVLTGIALENVEISTTDTDQTSPSKVQKVTFPNKAMGIIEADQHQRLIVRFLVRDTTSGQPATVHQAFVKISSLEHDKKDVIFIAEADTGKTYKFDMDVSASAKEFSGVSGKYSLELIIGDACINNPMVWTMAELLLTFPEGSSSPPSEDFTYKKRPEIEHQFRTPEATPPSWLSIAFTVLCLTPLIILIIIWMKLGVNISNFPLSLASIGFHTGLGIIFCLLCCFWLQLDMFTTLRYLFMIGVVTFFCGNTMLSSIASKRKESHE